MRAWNSRYSKLFQPALPMRGVTGAPSGQINMYQFQPALPMRGVTEPLIKMISDGAFQPALPMRGVTAILCAKFTASINI